MPVLRLFNPENDLALAAGIAGYTPPPAAQRLRFAGALLPMWLAREGDVILAPQQYIQAANEMRRRFGLHGEIVDKGNIAGIDSCEPWGWSAATAETLRRAGVDSALIPDSETIARLRALSHRRTAAQLMSHLRGIPAVEAATRSEALEAIDALGGKAFIKLPWSSSGRGVFAVERMTRSRITEYVDGFIRRQGSVMVEPAYSKVSDFAMLFRCSGGVTRYCGLSLFETLPGGAYSANILLPQSEIASRLGIDAESLSSQLIAAIDTVIAPGYSGPLGVDMLIAADSSGVRFTVPCIEVNLRYTMGFVALEVQRRLGNGRMEVVPGAPTPGSISLSPTGGEFAIQFTKSDL